MLSTVCFNDSTKKSARPAKVTRCQLKSTFSQPRTLLTSAVHSGQRSRGPGQISSGLQQDKHQWSVVTLESFNVNIHKAVALRADDLPQLSPFASPCLAIHTSRPSLPNSICGRGSEVTICQRKSTPINARRCIDKNTPTLFNKKSTTCSKNRRKSTSMLPVRFHGRRLVSVRKGAER